MDSKIFVLIFSLSFLIVGNIDCTQALEQFSIVNRFETEPQDTALRDDGYVLVTKVIDGDTFWIDNGIEQFKVRFIGVDAPETSNTRFKQKGFYAQQAKEYVKKLTENKRVKLEWDIQKKDRYNRHLAYIFLKDGTFLNAKLVEQGYAVVSTFPPNIKYVDLFIKFQKQAREQKLGLWTEQIAVR